jgi:hypothetical protein
MRDSREVGGSYHGGTNLGAGFEALRAVPRVQKERLISLYKSQLIPKPFDLR